MGGDRPHGAWYSPTVLARVTRGMRAYSEELFGPVAVVYRVGSVDEAIDLANDSPFGLASSVFTSDPLKADRVAEQLKTGMVWINSTGGIRRICRSAGSRAPASDANWPGSDSKNSRTRSS